MQDSVAEKEPASSLVGEVPRSDRKLSVSSQNVTVAEGAVDKPDAALSSEDNRRVLRKIDVLLMPLMCVTVLLQFLDKTSLNYANLLGVQKDLGLHGQQYSWLGSIFYIGYLAASPIHGFFLQKVHLSRYAACNVVIWGVCLALHAAAYNYASIVACRLFLGILEAGVTPCFILLTGRFYRRQEQVTRTGIWFCMNGWAQMLGGIVSWAILGQSENGLARWRQLFLILGCVTAFFGVVVFFVMPASPDTAKFLSMEERSIAVLRIRENKTGLNNPHFKWYQCWEALKDARLYLFFLGVLSANISNGGVTNFGTTIIKNFGFDPRQTALIGMSTGASEVVAVALGLVLARWTRTRVVPGVFSFVVAIIGGIMMIALPASNKAGRMAGYAIVFFYPCASPFYYSWLSSCISGSTKKIVFNVFLQLGYCTGNIIGPQTYRAADAPSYVPAKATLIAMFGVSSICLILISAIHLFENRRRDRKGEFGADEPADADLKDWTDREQRSFRYPY